jgi:4-amino-4-deoxy-L-arabinose transferase-like glycosyltransferase
MGSIVLVKSARHPYLVSVALFLTTVTVTLVFWAILPRASARNESSDFVASYEPVARSLLAGNGFMDGEGSVASRYPPGYPLVLAGVLGGAHALHVSERVALALFALVCMGGSAVLLYWLARLVWPALPALLPPLVWMSYPFGLWLSKQPNSELPFFLVLFALFLLFWRAATREGRAVVPFFLVGILVGVAMLIRPMAIGLGVLLALVLVFIARRFSLRLRFMLAGILLLGNLTAILPWELWVLDRTGK